jgi:hypothetical protein
LGIGQFRRVSYSELIDLQDCLLKGSKGRLTLSTPLPDSIPTRATIIGIFHHKAMEAATLGLAPDQLEEDLEQIIAAMQVTASAWQHLRRLGPIGNWDEINRSFTSAMRWSRERQANKSFDVVKVEDTLASADGLLFGKPDRYAIVADRALLTEFKTSSLRDLDGNIRKEYLTQLMFYATLLFDNYPVSQVAAQLEAATGEDFSVVIGTHEVRQFATEVRSALADANERIAGARSPLDLASPNVEACNYCSLRVLCNSFASRQSELPLARGQLVLTATVKTVAVREESAGSIELDRGDRKFRLVVPSEVTSEVQAGRRYAFANLDMAGSTFRWTDLTQVYSVD